MPPSFGKARRTFFRLRPFRKSRGDGPGGPNWASTVSASAAGDRDSVPTSPVGIAGETNLDDGAERGVGTAIKTQETIGCVKPVKLDGSTASGERAEGRNPEEEKEEIKPFNEYRVGIIHSVRAISDVGGENLDHVATIGQASSIDDGIVEEEKEKEESVEREEPNGSDCGVERPPSKNGAVAAPDLLVEDRSSEEEKDEIEAARLAASVENPDDVVAPASPINGGVVKEEEGREEMESFSSNIVDDADDDHNAAVTTARFRALKTRLTVELLEGAKDGRYEGGRSDHDETIEGGCEGVTLCDEDHDEADDLSSDMADGLSSGLTATTGETDEDYHGELFCVGATLYDLWEGVVSVFTFANPMDREDLATLLPSSSTGLPMLPPSSLTVKSLTMDTEGGPELMACTSIPFRSPRLE